jgi:hypothetical protein
MNNYCGQSVTLQYTLRFMLRQCPDSSTMENSRRYELDDVYGYPNRLFWTGLKPKHDIIRGAQGWRCVIRKENVNA